MRIKRMVSYLLVVSMLLSNAFLVNAAEISQEKDTLENEIISDSEDVNLEDISESEEYTSDIVDCVKSTVTDPDIPNENDNVIIYVLNKGTNHPDNRDVYYPGTTVKLKKPTRDGYKFKGWFDSPTFSKKAKIGKDTKGPVTVYAQWAPMKFPIKYVLKQSGTGKIDNKMNPKKYEVSETKDVELKAPSRKGYIFRGWYKDNTFTVSTNTISRNMVGKVFMYAKWEPTTYKLKFDLNGGGGTIAGAADSYTYDVKYKFPDVVNSGKKFVGWKTTQTGKGKIYKGGAVLKNIVSDGSEKTLYAVFKDGEGEDTNPNENASEYELEVLRLVNEERAKEGLSPLKMDNGLLNAAHIRSKEIKQYFSHTRPDGTKCFTAIANKDAYSYLGENIAYGQSSPKVVVDAWMHSEGHRKNILTPEYNCLGVGCYKDSEGILYWVQMFGRRN